MNVLQLFNLPDSCVVNLPITKVSLKSQDNITTSEVKLLDGSNIQSIRLIGSVNTANANIASVLSKEQSFVEVYFIQVILQNEVYSKQYKAIAKLLHKLIPHHCVVITSSDHNEYQHISLAKKDISKSNSNLRVITEELFSEQITLGNQEFLKALSFDSAAKIDLKGFYTYYAQVIKNYNLVDLTQEFKIRSYEVTDEMLKVSEQIIKHEQLIENYKNQLKLETQMNQKVRINSDIHALKMEIQELQNKIK